MTSDVWPSPRALSLWSDLRIRRSLLGAAGAVAVFALLGFLLLPVLLRPVLEDELSAALERRVTIGKLEINPFALSATLHDIAVGERGQAAPMLTVAELYVNGAAASL